MMRKFHVTLLLSVIIALVLKAASLLGTIVGNITSRFRVAESLNTRGDRSRDNASPQQNLSLDEMLAARGELGALPEGAKNLCKDTDLDEVDLSLFAPPAVATNQYFQIQVFLHLPNQQEWATSTARQIDDAAHVRGWTTLSCLLARGAKLTLRLNATGFTIEDKEQEVVWRGRAVSAAFFASAQTSLSGKIVVPSVLVLKDGQPVGRLAFKLNVISEGNVFRSVPTSQPARRYDLIFVSYSRRNLDSVLEYARLLDAIRQQFFMDIVKLRSGQKWEPEIFNKIESADLFLLFWSRDARESTWVRKEVEHALACIDQYGSPDFIAYPIEGPPIPELWDILRDRHVGDPIYQLRSGSTQAPRKKTSRGEAFGGTVGAVKPR